MKYVECSALKELFEKTFNNSVKGNKRLSDMLNFFHFKAFKYNHDADEWYLDIDYLNSFKKSNKAGYEYICLKLGIAL